MKFLQCISAAFLAVGMTNAVHAQSTSTDSKPKFGIFPKATKAQRVSFFLNYNSFPLMTKESSINFSYLDESPTPSEIKQTIALNQTSNTTGLIGGFEWQSKRNLVYRLAFGRGKSNGRKTEGDYLLCGFGYAMGSKRVQLFPFIDLIQTQGTMELADLKGDGFTVINNSEFYSNAISTSLSATFRGIRPSLGLNINVSKWVSLNANAGYVLQTSKFKAEINFSEPVTNTTTNETTYTNATETLEEKNLSFVVNGVREIGKVSIFETGGLNWTVGLNINISNRLFGK